MMLNKSDFFYPLLDPQRLFSLFIDHFDYCHLVAQNKYEPYENYICTLCLDRSFKVSEQISRATFNYKYSLQGHRHFLVLISTLIIKSRLAWFLWCVRWAHAASCQSLVERPWTWTDVRECNSLPSYADPYRLEWSDSRSCVYYVACSDVGGRRMQQPSARNWFRAAGTFHT